MLGLDTDIAENITVAVHQSIDETFAMMASRPISALDACEFPIDEPSVDRSKGITVLIGLDGGLKGLIGIGLAEMAALAWTKDLIDHDADDFDQTVVDAVGELANIIVGGAKRRLDDQQLKMGLPSVIKANWRAVAFTKGIQPLRMQFEFAESSIDVFVALDQNA